MTTASPELVLWDLDGALCPHNALFMQLAPQAVAAAALDFSIPLAPDEALHMARHNFTGQRPCVLAFAERFGLDEDALFTRYYHHLSADFLSSDPALVLALRNLTAQIACGILTQAPEGWAEKALAHLGLRAFFSDRLILGHNSLQGARKTDPAACTRLQSILSSNGYAPETVVLVDDKLRVLEQLKPCIARGIWIRETAPDQPPPPHIAVAASPLDAIALLNGAPPLAQHA